jgi:hypothetical protein
MESIKNLHNKPTPEVIRRIMLTGPIEEDLAGFFLEGEMFETEFVD